MRRLCLTLGIYAGLCGALMADPAVTVFPASMRAAPSPHARIVQRIPANAQIDLGSCSDNWCNASWRDIFGYVPVQAVEAAAYQAPRPAIVPVPVIIGGYGYGYHRRGYYNEYYHRGW